MKSFLLTFSTLIALMFWVISYSTQVPFNGMHISGLIFWIVLIALIAFGCWAMGLNSGSPTNEYLDTAIDVGTFSDFGGD